MVFGEGSLVRDQGLRISDESRSLNIRPLVSLSPMSQHRHEKQHGVCLDLAAVENQLSVSPVNGQDTVSYM